MIVQIPIQNEQINSKFNEAVSMLTEYMPPLIIILSVMLIYGLGILKSEIITPRKKIIYAIVITISFFIIGYGVRLLPELFANEFITVIVAIATVLVIIQAWQQIKLKNKS